MSSNTFFVQENLSLSDLPITLKMSLQKLWQNFETIKKHFLRKVCFLLKATWSFSFVLKWLNGSFYGSKLTRELKKLFKTKKLLLCFLLFQNAIFSVKVFIHVFYYFSNKKINQIRNFFLCNEAHFWPCFKVNLINSPYNSEINEKFENKKFHFGSD